MLLMDVVVAVAVVLLVVIVAVVAGRIRGAESGGWGSKVFLYRMLFV